jgi:CDP-diglyceride synthetase
MAIWFDAQHGWISIALTTLFFLFFVTVAASCGVMGRDWLIRAACGREKLSVILIHSSIFLVNFSIYSMNSDRIFSILARSTAVKES